MKVVTLLLCAVAAFGQSFPSTVYTPLVAKDNVQTTLSSSVTAGDTTLPVASSTGWQANMVAYICDSTSATNRCTGTFEAMLVTAVPNGSSLSVTRGYGSTTARAHTAGKTIVNAVAAVYNKALSDEVHAIETALGPNLSNVLSPGGYVAKTVSTRPSSGTQWTKAAGTVTQISVSGATATITFSAPHGLTALQSVIQVSGVVADDELNRTYVVQSTPTSTTATVNVSDVSFGIYADPTLAVDNRSNPYFGGDDSNIQALNFVVDSTVNRKAIWERYYNYELTPRLMAYDVRSGYSGTTARITSACGVSQADKKLVPVNDTTGFQVGDVIIIDAGGTPETRVIASINPGVSVSVTSDMEADHIAGMDRTISLGSRSISNAYHVLGVMRSTGGGDLYAYFANMLCESGIKYGQAHPFQNATCGVISGDTIAGATGSYIQSMEVAIADAGLDVEAVHTVASLSRTNASKAYEWVGYFMQSTGSQMVDGGIVLAGNYTVGIDLSRLTQDANHRAIQLPPGGRIMWEASYSSPSNPYLLTGNDPGDTFTSYNSSTSMLDFYVNGGSVMRLQNGAAHFDAAVNALGGIQVTGSAIFNPVAFDNLGTPPDGRILYCNNCTVAATCASGGTGAFAKRLNGAWTCN